METGELLFEFPHFEKPHSQVIKELQTTINRLHDENNDLKERLALAEFALDDLILGGLE